MAPSKIVLVRHAQSESNLNGGQTHLPDPVLTPAGEQQCRALFKQLKELQCNPTSTLVSPILRTLNTAIVGVGGIEDGEMMERMGRVVVVPELQETGNVPSDTPRNTNANLNILLEHYPKIGKHFDAWDISETYRESHDWQHNRGLFEHAVGPLKERAQYVLQYVSKLDGLVVLVSHGAFIRYLLGLEVNMADEKKKGYYYNNCEAREYSLTHGKLLDEKVLHAGAVKVEEKKDGYVT